MQDLETVINAAGKLTALGGSAQAPAVADAQAKAAQRHIDLARLREQAGARIAEYTGAEAACVTSGAAAGITISIAALLTGTNLERIWQLPGFEGNNRILLQAGHAVNFGAPVEQMIRLGGGQPVILGSSNLVSEQQLRDYLEINAAAGMLFVQSHHCVQENMVPLATCLRICQVHGIPLVVDAAAEDDLERYIAAGADLVTYSGGKAFGGPTVGFIAGRQPLIEACEAQFRGIARTMKVGKEAIAGLLVALEAYTSTDESERQVRTQAINRLLMNALADCPLITLKAKPDEAGRPFERLAVQARNGQFDIRHLVTHLAQGNPSIRTRNHHLDQGYFLLDPRELAEADVAMIAERIRAFDPTN
ncbi:MAG: SelA-like pyridoxal phosphate-dependent enzyme [Pseudomonadota bacterium]